jgi:spectrin beta
MDDLMRQMKTSEKPRDVSGVELLMNNHQGHKAEIDARADNFNDCITLGKELLNRSHYASNEIKEKLLELTNMQNEMLHRWEERWEHLQLILEVYQFARDAAVAEAWLMAQDPYLKSEELGQTIDEVENLIKKHEAFEKAAAAQEERFAALERLTTFELKELKRKQDEEELRRREEASRHSVGTDKTDGERSETQSIKSAERDGDELEGMLVRKHEWENTTKKASNRSWDKVCVVLKGTNLRFYKDQKSYRSSPDAPYRGEPAMELPGGKAEIATDYTKKRHVFRLKCANGGESLFQASDDDEMAQWVNSINQVAEAGASGSASGGRAQTLPAGQGPRGDEPKKRSFFTLKKK